jgi:class 3 adenylate cyclase/tetratricopeptide (TPR) repeat protein
VLRCPSCGEENPEHARFCLACGAALAAAPTLAREERKLVTVLFCDLVGFTARSEHADPEDVRGRLRPYHARLRKDIERFGGTVEKFIGDAVMAVFGAPVAHEDDAERAVRSALRITESIAELNEEQAGLDLAVRIGVNTGEAIVSLDARPEQGEGFVAGDVVNTAARFQTVAPVGGVVVGQITYRATRDMIGYETLEPVELKGKAEPVALWRAVAARSRFGVDVEQGTRTPFVGRARELQLVTQTFARAVEGRSAQVVTVAGEPGVGKTRLLWEFRAYLDDQPDLVYWRQGRCLPYGDGVTFWALGEMVKGQAGVLESDPPAEATAKLDLALEALSQDAEERDWLRARVLPLLGLGGDAGPGDRDESFTAWRRFLESIAARGPLVLVFEDLHWADPAMLAFIEHLVDWSTGVPMFVVCSARPELFERHPSWGGGKRNSTTISLDPLSEEDTAKLLASLLEQAVLPADVQAELLDRAGGNPLYAEEFVRMLTDRGILERRGASLRIEAPAGGIPMPESVHALIEARLDTLPPERKALLQDASVVGKVFWSGALVAMGGLDERTVRDGLHDLTRKELVRAIRSSSVQDQAEYSFWHALIRDVAYGQIPRAERASKHLAAATWTEALAGDRVADHAEFLAHHYERALELADVAGRPTDPAVRMSAARFLEMAGDRAAQLDLREAHRFYERAESMLAVGATHRAVVHVKTVDSAEAPIDEVATAYEIAIDRLKADGDLRAAGELLTRFSRFLRLAGQTERSDLLADEAVTLLDRFGRTDELASAYVNRAGNAMMGGRFDEWREWTDRSLQIGEELHLPRIRQRALQYRGIIKVAVGDDGLPDLQEALRLGLEMGLGDATATAYSNLGDWTSRVRGAELGLAIYREGIDFGDHRGLHANAAWSMAESTWPLFDLARWDEVLTTANDVRRRFEGRGKPQQVVIASTQAAHVRVWRGELEEAESLVDEALPAARVIHDVQVYRPALTAAARLEAFQRRATVAFELLEELAADLARGERLTRGYGVLDGVLIALRLGNVELAERLAGAGLPPAYPQGRLKDRTSQALVLEAKGQHEEAVVLFEEAAEGWQRLGHVFDAAIAQLGSARCLAALGRDVDASERARQAGRTFDTVRAVTLSAEAASLIDRASAVGS